MASDQQLPVTFVDFRCPYCGSGLSYPEAQLGTARECPHCLETVVVTLPNDGDGRLPVPITTKNLILRPPMPKDLHDYQELMKDEDSHKYLDQYCPDDDTVKEWFRIALAARLTKPRSDLILLAELKGKAKIIGYLSLNLNDPTEHRQAGVFL